VFNGRIDAILGSIQDPQVRDMLSNGSTHGYALSVKGLTGQKPQQTVEVYREALRVVWLVGLAFALVGFLFVFAEKDVEILVTLETEFSLEKKELETDMDNENKVAV
jgi:hypothetical protein